MMHRAQTTHTYELTKEEVTDAIIALVIAKQKSINKTHPKEDAVHLHEFTTREVTIVRDESPDRSIVGALVKFEP